MKCSLLSIAQLTVRMETIEISAVFMKFGILFYNTTSSAFFHSLSHKLNYILSLVSACKTWKMVNTRSSMVFFFAPMRVTFSILDGYETSSLQIVLDETGYYGDEMDEENRHIRSDR